MNAVVNQKPGAGFFVKDISLADWGRKEMAIAETEMPGLMAKRRKKTKSRSTSRPVPSAARMTPFACI